MAMMINDAATERQLITVREATGADRYDEVWEGLYMIPPVPNTEHQKIVLRLVSIFAELIDWPGLGAVMPGVNLSDRREDWSEDENPHFSRHTVRGQVCQIQWKPEA
jgi:hypothetical protein